MPYQAALADIQVILDANTSLITEHCRKLLMDPSSSEITLYDFEVFENFDININPHIISLGSGGKLSCKVANRPFLTGCENPLQSCTDILARVPEPESDEKEEFFGDFEDLLFNWFAACWDSSGASKAGLKGYLRFGKDTAWFDLQEKIWTDEDEMLTALGLDPSKRTGASILG